MQRLRDQLPLRRIDLPSWTEVDVRLAVRRLSAKHELWDLDSKLLGLVGGTGWHHSTGPSLSSLTSPH